MASGIVDQAVARNGVTIFLSTHFMNEAARCDRMSMMHAGKVLAQGPPAQLVAERKAKNLEDAFIGYLEEAAEKSVTVSATPEPAAEPTAPTSHPDETPSRFSLGRIWAFARREAVELQHDTVRLSFAIFGPILPDDRVWLWHLTRHRSSVVCGLRFRQYACQPRLYR